jgi:uncharacterized protein YggE
LKGILSPPVLLSALAGLCACIPVAGAADIPEYPFVFVIGKADADLPPDMASCTLTLRARDPDPGKAATVVATRLQAVLTTLGANQVQAADIESFRVAKQAITSQRDLVDPVRIEGYELWRTLKFKLYRLDSLAPIVDSLTAAPNVTDLDCQFDRTDSAAQEAELLTKALHDARDQADRLAGPLGRHVVAAAAVSRSPFDSISSALGVGSQSNFLQARDRMFRKSVTADALLVPATIHLSASVNVLFRMD